MSALTDLSLAAMGAGLASGEFTAVELAEAHIARVESQRDLNVFVTEPADRALKDARAADARGPAGRLGPLDGVPVAVKDMFCTQGVRTTASSKILETFVPPYESTVSGKLWAGGAGLLGKTACDEFAMGSSNLTSAFGPVANPWRARDD
ncbi:MAG: amidase, partial [Pseudomonadota bacterium]